MTDETSKQSSLAMRIRSRTLAIRFAKPVTEIGGAGKMELPGGRDGSDDVPAAMMGAPKTLRAAPKISPLLHNVPSTSLRVVRYAILVKMKDAIRIGSAAAIARR